MESQINALLFDLDGTLLSNNMDVFLPHYFGMLSAHVAHLIPPDQFLAHLMQATDAMRVNDGRATNEEVFASAFYPSVGHCREELEPVFASFYAGEFPKLRQYTQRLPEARTIVALALELGYRVAIATNPVFPAVAVEQRLAWAGLADLPFDLITTYENARATKPNPLYFRQILEAIGQPAEAALVIGDEDMDMAAAHVGCQTFLIPGPRTQLAPDTPVPTYRGTLIDVGRLIQDWRTRSKR
jgi:HAD superfamily hydrolase (TIGR01549 family)